MVWSAIFRWIAVARENNFGAEFLGSGGGGIEIFHFEPQQHAVAMGEVGISYGPVMILDFPTMQLQEQFTIVDQLFVMITTVAAAASQQFLVPAAAGFNVFYADQGLYMHCDLEHFHKMPVVR